MGYIEKYHFVPHKFECFIIFSAETYFKILARISKFQNLAITLMCANYLVYDYCIMSVNIFSFSFYINRLCYRSIDKLQWNKSM